MRRAKLCRRSQQFFGEVSTRDFVVALSNFLAKSPWKGPGRMTMKIHAGYEISYDCLQPTPMILKLSVHPTRRTDLLTPDRMLVHPLVPDHGILRRVRQYLSCDPCAGGPTDAFGRFPCTGQRRG